MPSLTLPGQLIWFAHCPKAGGTSVERFMVDTWGDAVGHLHWGWDLWWKRGGWRAAHPPSSPQHLIWEDARGKLDRWPDAIFAVVRDPVARMVSEYRYQRHARRGTVLGRALAHLPFSLWLRLMLGLAARNSYAFDNHLRPQSDFVPEGAKVFRLEQGLKPVTRWLAAEAGKKAGQTGAPRELAAKSGRKVRVSAQDARLIAQVFACDYARFGYDLPDVAGGGEARHRAGLLRLVLPLIDRLERCAKL